ncbi:putative RNA-binding protein (virulence factor B family) [Scopulibacillus daqui]|uniref:RNA-binding protein (Virulence factor B family) n=1 Tax=Scopulibacillus daqui TaxID=1469162 RepID=A0ABS2PWU2_9BACL|nr:S1-like domain-containing RNA-binding protein [Scopulibacillus daqui]MBM7644170.1 putative RNA-binding protein (virulence factor B family) [Scopulibacillus daqui]
MSRLQAGTIHTLKVARQAPFGYFLSNGQEDVLLHNNELKEGFDASEPQTVFLYQDHQGRLSATMTIPTVQIGSYDWVEVAGAKRQLGVFVSIGINKDILISKDDLPLIETLWPAKGDKLYCTLKNDKKGRLFAVPATENVMREIAHPAAEDDFNKNIHGYVYRLIKEGSFMMTEEGFLGFIHKSQRQEEPRLGQKVEGRIIEVKEDGSVNVSLLGRSHESIDDDAERIYRFLEGRGGAMPYSDKSLPEDIKERFGISKAAFKRALGRLMREGKVYQKEGWTYLKK